MALRIWKLLPSLSRWQLAGLCVLAAIGAAAPLASVVYLQMVVSAILKGDHGVALSNIVGFACAVSVAAGADFGAKLSSAAVGASLTKALQDAMFSRLIRMPLPFYTTTNSGALVSRLTNDAAATQDQLTSVLPAIISSSTSIIGTAIVLGAIDLRLLLVSLIIPVALIVVRIAEGRINSLADRSFSAVLDISKHVESLLGYAGVMLMRTSGRSAFEVKVFRDSTRNSEVVTRELNWWGSATGFAYTLGFAVMTTTALILVESTGQTSRSLEVVVAVVLLIQQLQRPVQALVGTRYPRARSRAAIERCLAVLDAPSAIAHQRSGDTEEISDFRPPSSSNLALEFSNVSFTYPRAKDVEIDGLSNTGRSISVPGLPLTLPSDVSQNGVDDGPPAGVFEVSFAIRRGKRIGLVGPSGAGKSTLALLATGQMSSSSGSIRVSGMDLTALAESDRARLLSFVSQDAHLRHTSIRENLQYAAPTATDEDMLRVLSDCGLNERIVAASGLGSTVGESGLRLSGGERQRFSLARALLTRPSVIVLDEPTAHLDSLMEHQLLEVIERSLPGVATLVIAHRMSTVRDADEIIVLNRGRVEGIGTHVHLMRTCDLYAQLVSAQERNTEVSENE